MSIDWHRRNLIEDYHGVRAKQWEYDCSKVYYKGEWCRYKCKNYESAIDNNINNIPQNSSAWLEK